MSLASASGYRSAIGPADFLEEFQEAETWEKIPSGHLLFQVDGPSGGKEVPHGSIIQVNFNIMPTKGDLTLALLSTEEFAVLKYYDRRKNVVRLGAIEENNPDHKSYLIDLYDPDGPQIHWMHPVVRKSTTPARRLSDW